LVFQALVGMGYDVKVNDPYKGVELVRAYSDPRAGRHSLQIEINKRLYLEDGKLRKSAGFSRLQKDLGELLNAVVNELSD
jgi:N-formylglutamate deformylase